MKKSLAITTLIVFLFLVIYVIIESGKIALINTILPEKIALFKNVHMSGSYSTNEAWEIWAKEAWTSRDKFTTTFENVTNGIISKNKRVYIKNIRSCQLRVNSSKDIEIIKKMNENPSSESRLDILIDFGALADPPKKKAKFSYVTADNIRFNPDQKKALVQNNVYIKKDDITVNSDKVTLDLDKNIATFESRTQFRNKKTYLTSNSAIAMLDTDIIDLIGSVEVRQKNKIVTSLTATYDDNKKNITMHDKVYVFIEKPKSIISKKSADKYKDKEAESTLNTTTEMYCDKLIIDTETDNANAYGNVHVKQKDKESKSDQAIYNEKDETINMIGNVYIKRKDDWLKAKKVVVYVDKEIFEAIEAETTFKVKKGSKR